jgi:peptidoglycan/xylan/chitin deacetylase (PgdA/CDA1 family)
MTPSSFFKKSIAYYKRNSARPLFRRELTLSAPRPLISFTFDDFPRSSLLTGGNILNRYGVSATYYVSLGLLGTDSVSGPICVADDLSVLLRQNHELGCHTFSHCHAWNTGSAAFENSVLQNREALQSLFPGVEFESLSFPISEPRPMTKRAVAKHFLCCRAGGQTLNAGSVDLNQLSAFFLEKSRDRVQEVKKLIDMNRDLCGWVIFATHDITASPSPYGCTPELFEEVVQYAFASGAEILPVAMALKKIRLGAEPATEIKTAQSEYGHRRINSNASYPPMTSR